MGLVDVVRLAEDRERYRRFVFGAAYVRLPGTTNSYVVGISTLVVPKKYRRRRFRIDS